MLKIENLSFQYPEMEPLLKDINFEVEDGDFIVLCGRSGCGKTTLLRLLDRLVEPTGVRAGEIYFNNRKREELTELETVQTVGYVSQKADNQLVTDKVWHELAFGLESLGTNPEEIRMRVTETAAYFGISEWFDKKVSELSGGQKQILSLASVMVMNPQILLLDEPTSQLDPIATIDFIQLLERLREEIGTTIIMAEHRLDHIYAKCTKLLFIENGTVKASGAPLERINEKAIYPLLPEYCKVIQKLQLPVRNLNTGSFRIAYLEKLAKNKSKKTKEDITKDKIKQIIEIKDSSNSFTIQTNNLYYKYLSSEREILRDISVSFTKGEIITLLGANGSGKSTLANLIADVYSTKNGKVIRNGIVLKMPQDIQTIFTKKTVEEDLKAAGLNGLDKEIQQVVKKLELEHLLQRHPYDLSGGEQQLVGFAKMMLKDCDVLILDEPTKGMDYHFKDLMKNYLLQLKQEGKTIILITHDMEFACSLSDRTLLLFRGEKVTFQKTREVLANNQFYTTQINRILFREGKDILTAEEAITYAKE